MVPSVIFHWGLYYPTLPVLNCQHSYFKVLYQHLGDNKKKIEFMGLESQPYFTQILRDSYMLGDFTGHYFFLMIFHTLVSNGVFQYLKIRICCRHGTFLKYTMYLRWKIDKISARGF